MRKTLTFTLLLCALAWGQDLPKPDQSYESVSIDLTGDGKLEKVCLVAYNIDKENDICWGQLVVKDSSGKELWKAPKAKKSSDPFSFGRFPFGSSNLEWIGDIDGDGHIELLSPEPVSDLRPPTYRRYRWKDHQFIPLGPKMLLEVPGGSGTFLWRDPIEWDGVSALTWITSISGTAKQAIAEVVSYRHDGSVWGGTAAMSGDGLGLRVTSWKHPLAPPQ